MTQRGSPMKQQLEWTKLPIKLRYLAAAAEEFGIYQFEDKIFRFLNGADARTKKELRLLVERIIPDEPAINTWLDEYNITQHREAQLVYFLMHLLALGNDAKII